MKVTGTWNLGKTVPGGQAKVYAHIPDHGAQTTEAVYEITTQFGVKTKAISQTANASNKWVSLGAYQFGGTLPQVKLSNFNGTGTGEKDIAWDAIAFVPGDYSGMPEISFPDGDPNAPEVDYAQQPMAKVPSPPMNFGSLNTAMAKQSLAIQQDSDVQQTLAKQMTEAGTTAAFESCPIAPGSVYNRYTACLTSSTPLTFVVIKNGAALEAKFNVHQQIQLYKNESSIDEKITINPVSINAGLKEIFEPVRILFRRARDIDRKPSLDGRTPSCIPGGASASHTLSHTSHRLYRRPRALRP